MNTNSNFKIISAGPPLSPAYEQRLLDLQSVHPQMFLSTLVVRLHEGADMDLDFSRMSSPRMVSIAIRMTDRQSSTHA